MRTAPTPPRPAADLVRPGVRARAPYTLDQPAFRFKLDQNESPWEPPAGLKRRVAAALAAQPWARYPDFHGDALRRDLADLHRWPVDGVLVGNGSNELLWATLSAVAGPGDEVLGLAPGFSLYPALAERSGARYRALGPRPDLALALDELEEALTAPRTPARSPSAVLICSPNNPTGEAVPPERLSRIAAATRGPLLLDAAYAEFCRWDYRPLLDEHPHLVLFRTFSKAWSLAGLRLGYLLARPELVAELIKVKLPYNVGHAAVAAGRAVLADRHRLQRRVRAVVGRRQQWRRLLAGHGLEVLPSEANFLLVRGDGRSGPREAGRLRAELAARGILLRDVSSGAGLAGCLRVTVGDGRALRATRAALAEILEGAER